jgi:hypothetical protein
LFKELALAPGIESSILFTREALKMSACVSDMALAGDGAKSPSEMTSSAVIARASQVADLAIIG